MYKLYNGDCLEIMDKLISEGIKVDAIITDPPYGTTACKWDSIIPFEDMWERLNKLIKENGAIVLFGSEPFTSELVHSNLKNFKTEWIYQKTVGSNFACVKWVPVKEHENIVVFGKNKKRVNYYPIKEKRKGGGSERVKYKYDKEVMRQTGEVCKIKDIYEFRDFKEIKDELRFPSSVRLFNNRGKGDVGLHPTQKPVALMEYLVKTYTQENETVLDFTMGSGTTGVACINTNRNFIGIELDKGYFNIAKERIENIEKSIFSID